MEYIPLSSNTIPFKGQQAYTIINAYILEHNSGDVHGYGIDAYQPPLSPLEPTSL